MYYILIEFTVGLSQQAYQEVIDGQVVRIVDLEGDELLLPEITESHVIDPAPPTPSWAI